MKSSRGRHILVTAGPTRERIDPVRFISNYSTGTFGYEIAKEAARRGFQVTLVSGPTGLRAPAGVRLIRVESASDMKRAISKEYPKSGCVIMAAAVSDWGVRSRRTKRKIKRGGLKNTTLGLIENPDILAELGKQRKDKILVGFALETEDLEKNAIKKLKKKNLDIVVANILKPKRAVFGDKKIDAVIIDRSGAKEDFFNRSKGELAKIILDKVEKITI